MVLKFLVESKHKSCWIESETELNQFSDNKDERFDSWWPFQMLLDESGLFQCAYQDHKNCLFL